jgi:outer membrane autotransporter protein
VHQVQVEYGLYLDGTSHTLLQAAGGINGQFDAFQINPSALMTATEVTSTNAIGVSFARLPMTTLAGPNTNRGRYAEWLDEQIATGALTPELTGYIDTLLQQPTVEQANGMLGSVSEPAATVNQSSVAILGAGYARAVFDRFGSADQARCTIGRTDGMSRCAWVRGLRQSGDADGDEFGVGYDWTTEGAQFGFDKALESSWVLGATLAFTNTDTVDVQGGRNDTRSAVGGMYANYAGERLDLSTVALYADNDSRTERRVALGTAVQQARARIDGDSYGFGARVGYRVTDADRLVVGPFAELFYDHIDGGDFAETGADAGDLSGHIHDRNGVRLTAGVHVAHDFETTRGRFWRPSLEVGVVRQLGNAQSTVDLAPFGSDDAFRTYGTALDRTAYVANATLGVSLGRRASLAIAYGGESADDYSLDEVNVGFRVVW